MNGTWTDVTTSNDTTALIVCGTVTSFSPFAAFELEEIAVTIDIKPGSYPNTINLGSNGDVPVAIFSTPTFDARTIDPTSLRLDSAPVAMKGKGTLLYSFEDVNGDGLTDLVAHFSTQALQMSAGDTFATLSGKTTSGISITGTDTVRVISPR